MSPAQLIPPGGFAALLIGVAAMPGRPSQLRAATGLPAFLLGVASLPFLRDLRGPEPTLWISAALLLLGPAAVLVEVWRSRGLLRARPIFLWIGLAGAAVGVVPSWPLLRLGGYLPAVLSAGALALGAAFLWLAAGAVGLGRLVRALDAHLPAPAQGPTYATYFLIFAALLAGLAGFRWPLWLQLWQPVGIGLGAWAVWWAAAARRPSLALAGTAFAAAFLPPGNNSMAWVTLGLAAMSVDRRPWVGLPIAVIWGYAIAGPLLGAEAVWTVLLAGGGSALLAGLAGEESRGVA